MILKSGSGALAALVAMAVAMAVATGALAQAPADGEDVAGDASEARILTVAVLDDAPPFSYVTPYGFRTGFEFELVRALCGRLPVECSFRPTAASQVVERLTARQVDLAVASTAITPALDEMVDFTRPYYVSGARFVVPDSASGDPTDSSAARILGAVRGTPHARYLNETVTSPSTVRLFSEPEAMWLSLALGRIDAALTSPVLAKQSFLSTPVGEGFRFAPSFVHDPESYGNGVGIAVRQGDTALQTMFDEALASFMGTEAYAALRDRYLDRDFVLEAVPAGE